MSDRPVLAASREELAGLLAPARAAGRRTALVPTMGALHAGHATLMQEARRRVGDGPLVVSIFVNPLQFGEGEDLDRYPRTLDADLEVCAREGVDVVFAPSVEEVYPDGEPEVGVDPGPLATVLEGVTRPGHFRGVLIVVAKLLGLVRPDVAVFGEKDYQQLALVRRMVLDLSMGVEIVGAATQRERDGLALSSRNRYLDESQRWEATVLSRALRAAQDAASYGLDVALDAARAELRTAKAVDLDYLAVTTPELAPLPDPAPPGTEARMLVAARLGPTRLIDNMPLTLGTPPAARAATATAGDAGDASLGSTSAREASSGDRERSEPGLPKQTDSPAKPDNAVRRSPAKPDDAVRRGPAKPDDAVHANEVSE